MIKNARLKDWISKGKQVGYSFNFEKYGEPVWSSVAIQKCSRGYQVYVDEILESEMAAENFLREEVVVFDKIECVFSFITNKTMTDLENLTPIKGQKIFNPEQWET